MTTKLATLYKKTSTGAIQQWSITVNGSTLITEYGQVDGKMQIAEDVISTGKNIGRSNETTPEQQALLEAEAQWEKKTKKRYVLSIADAQAEKVDTTVITGGVDPMLAQSFAKHSAKINYPAYMQPKLDGHRCVAMVNDSEVTLWSRTRKPITGVPHIIAELESLDLPDGTVLDGELYNHEYKDKFEELTSFIKRPEPKPGHEVVQYHVYDVVANGSFADRWNNPAVRMPIVDAEYIKLVGTMLVSTDESVTEFFAACVDAGYEGAMIRNAGARYANKRSYDLQKIKEWDDSEFEVVDVETGRGKMSDKAVFVCKLANGSPFRVKMKGSLDSLKAYVDDPSLAIGKQLTVQHQGLTADGIPRFPVGLRLRQDL